MNGISILALIKGRRPYRSILGIYLFFNARINISAPFTAGVAILAGECDAVRLLMSVRYSSAVVLQPERPVAAWIFIQN